jgi:hypothetical protein
MILIVSVAIVVVICRGGDGGWLVVHVIEFITFDGGLAFVVFRLFPILDYSSCIICAAAFHCQCCWLYCYLLFCPPR